MNKERRDDDMEIITDDVCVVLCFFFGRTDELRLCVLLPLHLITCATHAEMSRDNGSSNSERSGTCIRRVSDCTSNNTFHKLSIGVVDVDMTNNRLFS